jgi:hypothetical protein
MHEPSAALVAKGIARMSTITHLTLDDYDRMIRGGVF